jgi:hypothetical protein
LNTCEFQTSFNRRFKNMYLLNIMQDFQCDLNYVFLSEGLKGFEMHPNSFDFFQCDLNNMFLSGGVHSFKVFPQSSNCCLHYHNTMFPLEPPTNFKNRFIFSGLCLFLVLCLLWLTMLHGWLLLVVMINQSLVPH